MGLGHMRRDIAIALLGVAVFALLYGAFQMLAPLGATGGLVEVEIELGMTFREAVGELQSHGLVRDASVFVALGRLSGLHKRLRPGQYVFSGPQSTWSVLSTLRYGKVRLRSITISEGDDLMRIREKLAQKGIMNTSEFDALASDPEFIASLGINAPSLEGYLFPETYLFSKGIGPRDILSTMVRQLRRVSREAMARAAARGMDENQVLTLASIIEKEAYLPRERPVIAGVYHNRLRRGIPLQADPTVVYGIKPMSQGITREDLRRVTAYNTYVVRGLPPGPIASPGLPCIEAAVSPADVPYIYFVSNNDGSHVFTSTLAEHEQAVKAYRAGRSLGDRKKVEDTD